MRLYAFIRRPLKPQNNRCNRWEENRKNTKTLRSTKCTRPCIHHVRNINHVNIRHKTKEPKPLIGFPKSQLMLHERAVKRNKRFPGGNARTLKQSHSYKHLKKTNDSKNRKKYTVNKKHRIGFNHVIHTITSFHVLYDQYNKTKQFCKEKPTTSNKSKTRNKSHVQIKNNKRKI